MWEAGENVSCSVFGLDSRRHACLHARQLTQHLQVNSIDFNQHVRVQHGSTCVLNHAHARSRQPAPDLHHFIHNTRGVAHRDIDHSHTCRACVRGVRAGAHTCMCTANNSVVCKLTFLPAYGHIHACARVRSAHDGHGADRESCTRFIDKMRARLSVHIHLALVCVSSTRVCVCLCCREYYNFDNGRTLNRAARVRSLNAEIYV